MRAHFGQRTDDAIHGAPRERFIATDAGDKGLRGQDAREHADGGAGVAGIELLRWLAQGAAMENDLAIGALDGAPSAAMQASVDWQSAPVE